MTHVEAWPEHEPSEQRYRADEGHPFLASQSKMVSLQSPFQHLVFPGEQPDPVIVCVFEQSAMLALQAPFEQR